MKRIFTLFIAALLLVSCSKDKEKDDREDTPVTTEETQQQMESEPAPVSEPAPDVLVYTVQIGAFLQNVKTGTYKKSAGLFNYRYDDGYNRFYSGVFATYEEALEIWKKQMQ